jgi:hypothetical protein
MAHFFGFSQRRVTSHGTPLRTLHGTNVQAIKASLHGTNMLGTNVPCLYHSKASLHGTNVQAIEVFTVGVHSVCCRCVQCVLYECFL